MRILALVLLAALADGAAAQYRLEQSSLNSGAGAASSTNYRLQGCLDHDPAGRAASASYIVYSGCAAAAVLVPGETGALDGGSGAAATPAPFARRWNSAFAALLLMAVGLAALRRRRHG